MCKITSSLAPRAPSRWRRLGRRGLEWLFPSTCAACEVPLMDAPCGWFCAACWGTLATPHGPACGQCGLYFRSSQMAGSARCRACYTDPPHFDLAQVMAPYDGVAGVAVRLLKYSAFPSVARALVAQVDLRSAPAGFWPVDRVVPVPLHVGRLRRRGYNQAARLAAALADRIGRPYDDQLLARTGATKSQVGLGRKERLKNVKRAFAVAKGATLHGQCILLVDDVITTGATLSACADVLKRAGASRVVVWAVARQE